MRRVVGGVILAALVAVVLATTRASAVATSGRICKFANPSVDLGMDFITHASCVKFTAFAHQLPGMKARPRTSLYGEPRCAFKTTSASNVGVGVIVFNMRSARSPMALTCRVAAHWRGYTRVSILYAAAAAAAVNSP
jgi:hypothetical protein